MAVAPVRRAAGPRFWEMPHRLPWMTPCPVRHAFRMRGNNFHTFGPPPLIRYRPSGSGHISSLTANSPKMPSPWRSTNRSMWDSISESFSPERYSMGKWKSKWLCTMSVWVLHSRHQTHAAGMPRRNKTFASPSRTFAKRVPSWSSKATVPDQWMVRWATKGRPIDFAKLTASTIFAAWGTEMYLLPWMRSAHDGLAA